MQPTSPARAWTGLTAVSSSLMRPPRPSFNALLTSITLIVSLVFSLGPEEPTMGLAGALLISAMAATSVWLSGRRPVAALVLVTALTLALPIARSSFEVMDLVLVLVVFQVASATDLPPWLLAGVAFVTLTVNDAWQRMELDVSFMKPSVLYPLLLTALAVGLGLRSREVRRQHLELLELRDADHRRAVSEERRRIARDLHDVAAHHLSALVVRNKLALRIDTPEALREAASFTAHTAGETLDSLRQVVHVLSVERTPPLDPQPRLPDIDAIVGRMQEAGLEVECTLGDVGVPGSDIQLALVRIAQEALANVLRHRGPGRCWMRLERRGETLELRVDDDGPSRWTPEGPVRGGAGGYGILGMRERAEACGGRLLVGPSPRGGWQVSAVLPAGVP